MSFHYYEDLGKTATASSNVSQLDNTSSSNKQQLILSESQEKVNSNNISLDDSCRNITNNHIIGDALNNSAETKGEEVEIKNEDPAELNEKRVLNMIKRYMKWELPLFFIHSCCNVMDCCMTLIFTMNEPYWNDIIICIVRGVKVACILTILWNFLDKVFCPYDLYYVMCKLVKEEKDQTEVAKSEAETNLMLSNSSRDQ